MELTQVGGTSFRQKQEVERYVGVCPGLYILEIPVLTSGPSIEGNAGSRGTLPWSLWPLHQSCLLGHHLDTGDPGLSWPTAQVYFLPAQASLRSVLLKVPLLAITCRLKRGSRSRHPWELWRELGCIDWHRGIVKNKNV